MLNMKLRSLERLDYNLTLLKFPACDFLRFRRYAILNIYVLSKFAAIYICARYFTCFATYFVGIVASKINTWLQEVRNDFIGIFCCLHLKLSTLVKIRYSYRSFSSEIGESQFDTEKVFSKILT